MKSAQIIAIEAARRLGARIAAPEVTAPAPISGLVQEPVTVEQMFEMTHGIIENLRNSAAAQYPQMDPDEIRGLAKQCVNAIRSVPDGIAAVDTGAIEILLTALNGAINARLHAIEIDLQMLIGTARQLVDGQANIIDTLYRPVAAEDSQGNRIGTARRT